MVENTQKERVIITNGVPDLSLMPPDVLDMIAAVLELNIEKAVDETKKVKKYFKVDKRCRVRFI